MSKKIKKIIPYILILLLFIVVGLFSPMTKVHAKVGDTCDTTDGMPNDGKIVLVGTSEVCLKPTAASASTEPEQSSYFEDQIIGDACGVGWDKSINPFSDGCLKMIFYKIFHGIPAFFLWVAALLFNVLISVSLSSDLFKAPFVGQAWGVVRDFSNIFFILILLYIAIKIILDLGGSEAKKMISKVIIIALLINFSMFFTGIVIDASNILGLIFYNKINVNTTVNGVERLYSPVGTEKDIAGGLVNSFDPTKIIGEDFFNQAIKQFNPSTGAPMEDATEVPISIVLSVILLAGAVMCVAAYVFFVSGFFFLARLIELWFLIIFSPFAFMSSTVPLLSGISDIGWKQWFDRLISSAFMAPIFMFLLYFIFTLVGSDIYKTLLPDGGDTTGSTGMIKMILGVVLPSILICVLLLKAKKYAKKGGGAIGEMVMTGAKMVGGLALGATAGVAAVGLRSSAGRVGTAMTNSRWAKKWEASGFGGEAGMSVLKKIGGGSFDIRGAKMGGQTLASATGMKVGEAQKGGFAERREKDTKKRIERAKEVEIGEDEKPKRELNEVEGKLQNALSKYAQEITNLDKTLEGARKEAGDAEIQFKAGTITKTELQQKTDYLKLAKADKKAFMKGEAYMAKDSTGKEYMNEKGTGVNIEDLETKQKELIQTIKTENVVRRQAYAKKLESGGNRFLNLVLSGGQYSLLRGANEAANKIRKETKLDSGTKT